MYGSLQEIDVSSLLTFFSEQQRSGIFFIENELPVSYQKNIYFLFFSQGKIVFAGDINSFNCQRIQEYLLYYNLTEQFKDFQDKLNESASITEYEAILLLQNRQLLSTPQLQNLCKKIIEEVLLSIIHLKTGSFIWQNTFNLQPLIISVSIETILPSIIEKKVAWYKLFPYIKEIDEYPIIIREEYFLRENIEKKLFDYLDGKSSLLQLSRMLNKSIINIAQILYPHIQKGRIKIISQQQTETHSPVSLPISAQIIGFSTTNEWTLNTSKISYFNQYKFLIVDNLNQFLTYIFHLPIKLIILQSEIDNNYNTYNLCKIIRNNEKTSNLPIIMVVDEYLFKDNLISKMYGVTEYISANLFQKRMLKILDKYL